MRRRRTKFGIRVKCRGFPETESDRIELSSLQEGVPDLISEYINDIARSGPPLECKFPASHRCSPNITLRPAWGAADTDSWQAFKSNNS